MGSVIDNEKTKGKCQIFTPIDVVEKMLNDIGYTTDIYGKTILENSCGDGHFLQSIVRRYICDCERKRLAKPIIRRGLETDICGIEIDKELYNICLVNLNQIALDYGIKKVRWNILNQDTLRLSMKRTFDFIIGNPPFVSYWDLEQSEREFINEHYSTCKFGAWDYSYAFLEEGIRRLSEQGKLTYIIPNSIFKTKSGTEIRSLIKPLITKITDYTTTRIFDHVLTSPAIIIIEKGKTSSSIEYNDLSKNTCIQVAKNQLDKTWIFENSQINKKYSHRFGDYFNVATGVATQLNRVFVIKGAKASGDYLHAGDYKVERCATLMAASPKGKKLKRQDSIIFPYYYCDSQLLNYTEEDFKSLFPKTYEYLLAYREDLGKRAADKKANWFEYGRSQALAHLNQPKLLLSTVITGSVFVYELGESEVPYSGLYISEKSDLTLKEAKVILESKEFFQYISQVGVNANGKSLRIVARNICDYCW